jgi:hypothetical protein
MNSALVISTASSVFVPRMLRLSASTISFTFYRGFYGKTLQQFFPPPCIDFLADLKTFSFQGSC